MSLLGSYQVSLQIEKINWEYDTRDLVFGFDDKVDIIIASNEIKYCGIGEYGVKCPTNLSDKDAIISYIANRLEKWKLEELKNAVAEDGKKDWR